MGGEVAGGLGGAGLGRHLRRARTAVLEVRTIDGISGKAGNLRGKKIDGGNIFEGTRQQEYPTPPLKHSYASSMFEDAVRKLGYHPYPTPAANLSETYKNPDGITRAACAYCGTASVTDA